MSRPDQDEHEHENGEIECILVSGRVVRDQITAAFMTDARSDDHRHHAKKRRAIRVSNPQAISTPPTSSDSIAIRACKAGAGMPNDFNQPVKPLMFPGPTIAEFAQPVDDKAHARARFEKSGARRGRRDDSNPAGDGARSRGVKLK